jgi:uncharacterized membrane protein
MKEKKVYWFTNQPGVGKTVLSLRLKTYLEKESVFVRHILKTLTYRFFATLTTITTVLLLGASIEVSSLLGLGELLIKPILYFLHERIWYKFIKVKK